MLKMIYLYIDYQVNVKLQSITKTCKMKRIIGIKISRILPAFVSNKISVLVLASRNESNKRKKEKDKTSSPQKKRGRTKDTIRDLYRACKIPTHLAK